MDGQVSPLSFMRIYHSHAVAFLCMELTLTEKVRQHVRGRRLSLKLQRHTSRPKAVEAPSFRI